ncbi:MAG: dephospho-CoA kinase [Desulfovibrio sp.]|jgi:23S rRNA pseudouridine1911/1915/1917 synthase|nr:dephospho-CoA kinase [Desulfovibrio sp.]
MEETFILDIRDGVPGPNRLDACLAPHLRGRGLSREKIKNLIRNGMVTVNGQTAFLPRTALAPGDRIEVSLRSEPSSLVPKKGDLKVLYRDAVLAVLDKPAGLAVHPGAGAEKETLAHRLAAEFPELAAMGGFRPGIVHRLDKGTSGLLLTALTEQCRLLLAGMFARREIHKEYLALLHGTPKNARGTIETPIGRDSSHKTRMAVNERGREAKTVYRVIYSEPEGRFSLAAIRIFSGRTHQVRVHMQSIGHPLLGDPLYKSPAFPEIRETAAARQMLHASALRFAHPLPGKAGPGPGETLSFCRLPPADFFDCALQLSRSVLRVVITGAPGCGKSALLSTLAGAGLPVFSADKAVAGLYAPGGEGTRRLQGRFGDRFVPEAGSGVNKAALGSAMREDQSLRREVEALVHPLVFQAMRVFWADCEASGHTFAAAEIPLYFETAQPGRRPPLTVGVRCPFPIRHARLVRLRGWTEEVIAGMESWQWPEEKKMAACDFVVDNSGGLAELKAGAEKLLVFLRGEREKNEAAFVEKFSALCAGGFYFDGE